MAGGHSLSLPRTKESDKAKIGKFKVSGGTYDFKELKEKFASGGDGPVIYLKPDQDIRVRFISSPEEWRVYESHRLQKDNRWFDVPCIGDGCPADEDGGDQPRTVALVPLYIVEKKKVKFFKASPRLMNDMLTIYNRTNKKGKSKLLDRDYNILREGEGKETRYLLDAEEPEKRPEVKELEVPDADKLLTSWVKKYWEGEEGASKKKRRDDDDDDFDEKPKKKKAEDDDEDEEEEEPKKKKKAKKDESDDEDEEETKDEEEEDDEDEEEDEEKPRKRKKDKVKKLKSKKSDDDDDDEEEDEPKKKKKKDDDDEDEEDDD